MVDRSAAASRVSVAARLVTVWSPWWLPILSKATFVYRDGFPSGITGFHDYVFVVDPDFAFRSSIMDVAIRLEFAIQQATRAMDLRMENMRDRYPRCDESLIALAQSLEINSDIARKFAFFDDSTWQHYVSRVLDKNYVSSFDAHTPPRLPESSWTSQKMGLPDDLRAESYLSMLVEMSREREQQWLDEQDRKTSNGDDRGENTTPSDTDDMGGDGDTTPSDTDDMGGDGGSTSPDHDDTDDGSDSTQQGSSDSITGESTGLGFDQDPHDMGESSTTGETTGDTYDEGEDTRGDNPARDSGDDVPHGDEHDHDEGAHDNTDSTPMIQPSGVGETSSSKGSSSTPPDGSFPGSSPDEGIHENTPVSDSQGMKNDTGVNSYEERENQRDEHAGVKNDVADGALDENTTEGAQSGEENTTTHKQREDTPELTVDPAGTQTQETPPHGNTTPVASTPPQKTDPTTQQQENEPGNDPSGGVTTGADNSDDHSTPDTQREQGTRDATSSGKPTTDTYTPLEKEIKNQSTGNGHMELYTPVRPEEDKDLVGLNENEIKDTEKEVAKEIQASEKSMNLPGKGSPVGTTYSNWSKKRLKKSKAGWKKLLPRMLTPVLSRGRMNGAMDLSYAKRNNNQKDGPGEPILMGWVSYPPNVTILIDTSPSMVDAKDTVMKEFIAVLRTFFVKYSQPVTVMLADGDLQYATTVPSLNKNILKKVGRTYSNSSYNFGETVKKIMKRSFTFKGVYYTKPDILVVLTDCEFYWPYMNKKTLPQNCPTVVIVSTNTYDRVSSILPPWVKNKKNFIHVD